MLTSMKTLDAVRVKWDADWGRDGSRGPDLSHQEIVLHHAAAILQLTLASGRCNGDNPLLRKRQKEPNPKQPQI